MNLLNKKIMFVIICCILFCPLTVFAASCDDKDNLSDRLKCLKNKYEDLPYKEVTSKCNLTKEQCDSDKTCVWLEKDSLDGVTNNSCGIKQNSTIGYTCRYAADINGSSGIYIELNLNSAWFNSGYFYTSGYNYSGYRDKIAFPDYIENSFGTSYENKNGDESGIVWYCPPSIYFETSEKTDSEGKYFERKIFTESKVGRTEAKLLIDDPDDDNNTFNYIMAVEPDEPLVSIREPLTCNYSNITAGSVRNISLTYVSDTEITAEYIDDMGGLVKSYNIDSIFQSQAFKEWKCASEDNVFTQVVQEDGEQVLYISYDKSLLPDPNNNVQEFDPSAPSEGGQTGNKEPVGKCEVVPPIIIKYLQSALKLLRWVALVLMIILGVLDFVKAAMADDQDALKKAWQHFIKRLIAVIILFLLPILIDFVLYIAGLAGFGCPDYNASNF